MENHGIVFLNVCENPGKGIFSIFSAVLIGTK